MQVPHFQNFVTPTGPDWRKILKIIRNQLYLFSNELRWYDFKMALKKSVLFRFGGMKIEKFIPRFISRGWV